MHDTLTALISVSLGDIESQKRNQYQGVMDYQSNKLVKYKRILRVD